MTSSNYNFSSDNVIGRDSIPILIIALAALNVMAILMKAVGVVKISWLIILIPEILIAVGIVGIVLWAAMSVVKGRDNHAGE